MIILVAGWLVLSGLSSASEPSAKIDPRVHSRLDSFERISVMLRFDSTESLARVRAGRTTDEPAAVRELLLHRARTSQAGVRRWLDARGIPYRPLYIVNGLQVEVDRALLDELVVQAGVVRVAGDPRVYGLEGWSLGVEDAPGAEWIACRALDNGWGTSATYLECLQFLLAPWPLGGDPEQDSDPTKAVDVANAWFQDSEVPASSAGFYYLSRAENACGDGGWGRSSVGLARGHADCP